MSLHARGDSEDLCERVGLRMSGSGEAEQSIYSASSVNPGKIVC